jgi:peptidoglycan/LPS O-acetylase OafA/YrhL
MGARRREGTVRWTTSDQDERRRATTALILAISSIGTGLFAAHTYGHAEPALAEISGILWGIAAMAAMAALTVAATVGPGPARKRALVAVALAAMAILVGCAVALVELSRIQRGTEQFFEIFGEMMREGM